MASFSGCAHKRSEPAVRYPERSIPNRWPVASPQAKVTSEFNEARDLGTRNHKGMDISVPEGTPVCATAKGWVVFSGFQQRYGELVILRHDHRLETVYAHLKQRLVQVNQQVSAGQTIGKSGRSGNATGAHVHYEIRRDGRPVNPAPYLPGRTPPRK